MYPTRRHLLKQTAIGFGSLACSVLHHEWTAASNPLAPKPTHFPARAKRVIMLFMEGGPSQMDTIDYKPELARFHDQPIPESATPKKIREGKGEPLNEFGNLMGPVAEFRQRGESGLWLSDAIPHIATMADELCILNGMVCDSTEHGTAVQQFHTGMTVLPRPSMGAWLMYGLGTENQNLPGFVVVSAPAGSNVNCGTDFLPGIYQSTMLRDSEKPDSEMIRHLSDKRLPRGLRRSQLDLLAEINREHAAAAGNDNVFDSLIEANELAFRMQSGAPQTLDISQESEATLQSYGIGDEASDAFGRQCLIARRLAEAGVRFIQVTNKDWDHHRAIRGALPKSCSGIDKPVAGLLADLKQRGLLDDTLIIWSGEFGRTPVGQGVNEAKSGKANLGRGHNPFGWSLLMAGAGLKKGFVHGATDDFGYSAIQGRVHVHDLHATILHMLGLDHEKLTYMHAGRPYRLTDVYGEVVKEIMG